MCVTISKATGRSRAPPSAPSPGSAIPPRGLVEHEVDSPTRCRPDHAGDTTASPDEIARRYGFLDRWPVLTEPFTQWVLQDSFTLGRPDLGDVGVQLVTDVAPYELMKLRLLNASHQALAYLGYLSGYRLVHDAAQDPDFRRFCCATWTRATPTCVRSRASIWTVQTDADRTLRQPASATPSPGCAPTPPTAFRHGCCVLCHQLAADGDITCAATVVAAWARYAEGVDEDGAPIEVVDRRRDQLVPLARRRDEPTAFLTDRSIFGT